MSKTVSKDLENIQQALLTGKPGPKRAAPRWKECRRGANPTEGDHCWHSENGAGADDVCGIDAGTTETTAVSSEHTPSAAASTEQATGSAPEG